MAGFLSPLEVEELGEDRWRLLAPLGYQSDVLPHPGEQVWVPGGFETDLESIPRWLPLAYAVLYGTAHAASVVHDWLYTIGAWSRRIDDAVLYEAMRATGQPRWKAFVIWLGVRLGGGRAWARHRRDESGAEKEGRA